jgi:hypothetical protein
VGWSLLMLDGFKKKNCVEQVCVCVFLMALVEIFLNFGFRFFLGFVEQLDFNCFGNNI